MDSRRLPVSIHIPGAEEDAGVLGLLLVKTKEVTSVHGQHRAPSVLGEREHFTIGDASPRVPCLLAREDVVSESPQPFDDLTREVLVGIQGSRAQASSCSRMACSISSRCAAA